MVLQRFSYSIDFGLGEGVLGVLFLGYSLLLHTSDALWCLKISG